MIYLDHAATSPLLPEVRAAIEPWLGVPANPSSVHAAGRAAAMAVERAREAVGALLGRDPAGIVFCSGATEANHLGIRGWKAARILASPIEHPSAEAALAGAEIARLPIDRRGVVEPASTDADLVVCLAVSHEIGTVQPIRALRGRRLHVDATQAAGRIDLRGLDADSVVISGHKLGGPAGVGALSLRDGGPFPALLTGGPQERGRRAGTLNVAGIVGLAAACALAEGERAERAERHAALAEALRAGLIELGGRIVGEAPVPAITCAVFDGLRADSLVQALDLRGVATSAGAACASGATSGSPVLRAIGEPDPRAGLRISLGPRTTGAEIDQALDALRAVLPAARAAARWEREGGP